MSVFSVNQFTGGMNNWMHPSLIGKDTAQDLTDATIENGKILPILLPASISDSSPEDLGHYGTRNRSLVKWYERNYWSNNEANVPPYYGGDKETLGVPYPESHPSPESVDPEEGEEGLTGTFKYCWCYVSLNGWESAPCPEDGDLWVEISVENKNIQITAPELFPDGISYIKIYRTGNKGGDFYCVGEIKDPGGTFTDHVDDVTLLLMEPASCFDNYPPPDKGRYLTESGGVFFLAVKTRVYFSIQNNPHAWPTLNFIEIGDKITGITPEFQGVLVFTTNNTYRIVGAENEETVTKTMIPGNQGCVNSRSIAHVSNSPIWLSNDGICLWNGESISIVSNHIMKTERLQVKYAVSANDIYYLFLLSGAIVFDRRNGNIFRKLSFTCDYAWYDEKSDKMFLQKNNTIYEYGAGPKARFVYRSPAIGESELTLKTFTELFIVCSDSFFISADLDGKRLISKHVQSGGRKRMKFPYSSVGKSLQIQIESKGELSEYAMLYQ